MRLCYNATRGDTTLKLDSAYHLFQGQFSPNGRWIVFESVRNPPNPNVESALYVMPLPADRGLSSRRACSGTTSLAGLLTETRFTSSLVVAASLMFWGIRFDSTNGKSIGDAFRVTSFVNPALMLPDQIVKVELSVTPRTPRANPRRSFRQHLAAR
jgi:hypothetical protein